MTKIGSGTETLTGANSYTGGTTIDAGTLAIGAGGSLASTGAVTLANAGTGFDISGASAAQTIGALSGVAGSSVTLGGNTLTFGDTTDQTFGGTIDGTGGIVKQGSGTETLTGANTYTGGTTVDAGTLALGAGGSLASTGAVNLANSGAGFDISGASGAQTIGALSGVGGTTVSLGANALTFGDASSQTVGSTISGTGGIVKQGSGTETLTGANTYSGGTTLNAGGLVVGNDAAFGTGAVTVNGASTLDSTAPVTLGNDITLNNGLTVLGSNDLTLNGALSGTGGLTKDGAATLTLNGANTYTGGTTINAGTLALGANASLAASGIVDVANGATFDLSAGNGQQQFGTLVGGGTINLGANTLTLGDATDGTFTGGIAGTGGGIVKQGSGTETLTGTSTYTGATTIDDGTLALAGSGTLSDSTNVNLANAGTSFDISGSDPTATPTVGSLSGVGGTSVTLGGNTLTLGGGSDGSYGGTISGTGGIVKAGAGTQTLSGANTYSGGTTLEGGTLVAGNDAALGTGTLTVAAPATLDASTAVTLANAVALNDTLTIGGSADTVLSGVVSGTGAVVKNGAADLTLTGANTYSGGTTLNDGTLTVGSNTALGTGGLTVNGGTLALGTTGGAPLAVTVGSLDGASGSSVSLGSSSLTVNGGGSYAGSLTGTGSVTKAGSGTLTLGGTSTYSGPTTVAGGTLDVSGSTANSTATVQNGATLTGTGTVGGLIVQSGGTAAALTPGQSLNVAGNVTFESGSNYQVAATPTQAGKIAATGSATLNGGVVSVLAGQGAWSPQTQYPILTAAGGVSGAFQSVSSTLAFLTPTLSYTPNTVNLTLTRNDQPFTSVAVTPNQSSVATAVASLSTTGPLYQSILGTDAATARHAYDMIDGQLISDAKTVFLLDTRYLRDAVTDRLRQGLAPTDGPLGALSSGPALCDSRLSQGAMSGDTVHGGSQGACANSTPYQPVVWAQGYGADSRLAGDANAAGLDRTTAGFIGGADMALNDQWRVGVAGGFAHSSLENGLNSTASVDTYHVAMYGGAQYGPIGVRLGAAYTWNDASEDRYPAFTGFSDHDSANYDAKAAQVFGEVGYAVPFDRFAVEPFAGLAYVNLHSDGFSENGGQSALRAQGDTENIGFSTLGLRVATRLGELPLASVSAHAMAGWRHAFGNTQPTSTLAFIDGGSAFSVAGVPIARDTAVVELGLDASVAKNLTLGVAYSGQYGGGSHDNAISGRLAWRF
nr:autotransporter domain-containing protein [Paraburkholderia sp. Ac-20347]